MILGTIYIVWVADSFLGVFMAFLIILGVPMAAWWDQGKRREYVSRVGPPAANIRRNLTQVRIDWYAVFEFRDGNWYCTFFVQCCD